jgi:hypothetical protein
MILKGLYWLTVGVCAVALLPLTIIALWFWVQAERAEREAAEATEHYTSGVASDE